MYKTNMEDEKNNALCRNLYDYKLQNVAPHRNDWSRRHPDGAREASGRLPDGLHGLGRLLVGPDTMDYINVHPKADK